MDLIHKITLEDSFFLNVSALTSSLSVRDGGREGWDRPGPKWDQDAAVLDNSRKKYFWKLLSVPYLKESLAFPEGKQDGPGAWQKILGRTRSCFPSG